MAKLVYITNTSLDAYIEDRDGNFGWSEPDAEVHQFYNDLIRTAGTFLYGRRLYETMAVWETDPDLAADNPITKDFAEGWQAAEKIVYSTTLERVVTARTRIERTFDPAAVRDMKASATRDLLIGGAELAGEAFRAGVVDEVQLMVSPHVVGGGKPALRHDLTLDLALLDVRRFATGAVLLRYGVN